MTYRQFGDMVSPKDYERIAPEDYDFDIVTRTILASRGLVYSELLVNFYHDTTPPWDQVLAIVQNIDDDDVVWTAIISNRRNLEVFCTCEQMLLKLKLVLTSL